MAAKPVCVYLYLGTIEYQTAWNLQKELAERRFLQEIPNLLLLMQHPHTITIGKTGNKEHLLVDPAFLAQKGITLLEVDRGGDITYHGPGQLIGYPILALPESQPDVIAYLRQLEETLICTLQQYHIPAGRKEEYTGVWVAEEKVAAIGVKSRKDCGKTPDKERTTIGVELTIKVSSWRSAVSIRCAIALPPPPPDKFW